VSLLLILTGAALAGSSGLPAILSSRQSDRGQRAAAVLSVAGSALGLSGVALFLLADGPLSFSAPWEVPGGSFTVGVDGISALFLIPVFLISALGSIYGLQYWRQSENQGNGRKLRLFYGLLTGAMALLLLAQNSVLFMLGWEGMAISAWFLVATEDREAGARQAAWTYLVATHAGSLALFALFALMRNASGSFDWTVLSGLSGWAGSAIFLLALLGFGLKAGIMPFHFWLPSAHSSAPSHVSALMSGVMIKMGLYGIVRVTGYLGPGPLWWGLLLLVLGGLSAIIAVAAALAQSDLKRMLAYSSIENAGIMTLGIGLALMGRSLGIGAWIALGLGGSLLHVLNHSLFKPLLFFSSGSVIHAAGTRAMDRLGGLARRMGWTSMGFLVGAAAICGLPVLNGFASELLIYLGLFQSALSTHAAPALAASLAAAGLALAGGLAAACFVRAFGSIFLGSGRSAPASEAREAGRAMTSVMAALASGCLVLGVAPWITVPLLDRALGSWAPGLSDLPGGIGGLCPLREVGAIAAGVGLLMGLVYSGLRWRSRSALRRQPARGTWDCGYAEPSSPRLQYTASSSAQMLVGLFHWAVKLQSRRPAELELFPAGGSFQSEAGEPLLGGLLNPFFRKWAERFQRLRILQQGHIQIYLVYILATLVLIMAFGVVITWSGP
jgi:hydrogenase-4 component B